MQLRSKPDVPASVVVRSMHRPRFVHVLGDSHALVFGGRIVEVSDPVPGRYFFQTAFVPGIRAEWFSDENGNLGAPVASALLQERILVDVNGAVTPYHFVKDRAWRGAALLEGRSRPPSLALSCAGFDVMYLIWNLPQADIEIPDSVGAFFDIPQMCRTASRDALSWDVAMQCCRALLEPLETGLAHLRRMQLRALMVLSLTPPTPSDVTFRAMAAAWGYLGRGPRTFAAWRYKVAILMNEGLRRVCEIHDVPFINFWNETTRDGLADPQSFRSDTIHLNSEAAAKVIAEMIAWTGVRAAATES